MGRRRTAGPDPAAGPAHPPANKVKEQTHEQTNLEDKPHPLL